MIALEVIIFDLGLCVNRMSDIFILVNNYSPQDCSLDNVS